MSVNIPSPFFPVAVNVTHPHAIGLSAAYPAFAPMQWGRTQLSDFFVRAAHSTSFSGAPTYQRDYDNAGLYFDGSGDYCSLPYVLTAPRSAIATFYFDFELIDSGSVKTFYSMGDSGSNNVRLVIGARNDATVTSGEWRAYVQLIELPNNTAHQQYGDVEITEGRHTLFFVFSQDISGPDIWLDGVQQTMSVWTGSPENNKAAGPGDIYADCDTSTLAKYLRLSATGETEYTLHDFRIFDGIALDQQRVDAILSDKFAIYRPYDNITNILQAQQEVTNQHNGYLNLRYATLVAQSKNGFLDNLYALNIPTLNFGYLNLRYDQLSLSQQSAYLDNLYALLAAQSNNGFIDNLYALNTYDQNNGYLAIKYRLETLYVPPAFITGIYYELVLTGDADSLDDLTLPMSSFQVRLRLDTQDYASVVIPNGLSYASDIEDRSNGDIVINAGVRYTDGTVETSEFIRVDLEDIVTDQGARSNSITLQGHKAFVASTPKTVVLESPSYRNVREGVRRFRTKVDTTLKIGDTASINGETLVVDNIVYSVSINNATMEFAEA